MEWCQVDTVKELGGIAFHLLLLRKPPCWEQAVPSLRLPPKRDLVPRHTCPPRPCLFSPLVSGPPRTRERKRICKPLGFRPQNQPDADVLTNSKLRHRERPHYDFHQCCPQSPILHVLLAFIFCSSVCGCAGGLGVMREVGQGCWRK